MDNLDKLLSTSEYRRYLRTGYADIKAAKEKENLFVTAAGTYAKINYVVEDKIIHNDKYIVVSGDSKVYSFSRLIERVLNNRTLIQNDLISLNSKMQEVRSITDRFILEEGKKYNILIRGMGNTNNLQNQVNFVLNLLIDYDFRTGLFVISYPYTILLGSYDSYNITAYTDKNNQIGIRFNNMSSNVMSLNMYITVIELIQQQFDITSNNNYGVSGYGTSY